MKIQGKEIAKVILTLGFYGYLQTRRRIEENGLKQRVIFSEQILGLMLALPILSALTIVFGFIEDLYYIHEFPEQMKAWFDIDNHYPKAPAIIDSLLWIPHSYILFIMLHTYLGVGFFQHCKKTPIDEKWKVLLFGFYALEWNVAEHFEELESEPDV